MTTIPELANRVQKLKGPDTEVDALIWCAVFAPKDAYVEQSKFNGAWCIYLPSVEPGRSRLWEARNSRVQPVTSSFDAALLLVPEEHDWIVGSVNGQVGGTPYACVGSEQSHYGATPVLSLVLAAVRVRFGSGT